MCAAELTQAGHTRRFVLSKAHGIGWEFTEERDSEVISRVSLTDWHRVERALSAIRGRVLELEEAGWRVSESLEHSRQIRRAARLRCHRRYAITPLKEEAH